MNKPRIDSVTIHIRRGSPPRKLKEGDEKYVKGVLMVRQQMQSFGMNMVSNGRPVWEWVAWGSERDRNSQKARYRTLRGGGFPHGELVPPPPDGWKIIESGRPVPEGSMVFFQGYTTRVEGVCIPGEMGWRLIDPSKGERFGMEATYEGERRAFAIPKTKNEKLRDKFEASCSCKQRKRPVSESANVAVKKYMARCKCSVKQEVINGPSD
jgi:hypothetical protein